MHGRGQRRERKGSPLLNILRQRADALNTPMVWVELANPRSGVLDNLTLVDLSPLRSGDDGELLSWQKRCTAVSSDALLLDDSSTMPIGVHHSEAELLASPIWALLPCTIRLRAGAGQEQGSAKAAKQLAAALVVELGAQEVL